jgi:hypothetical protein
VQNILDMAFNHAAMGNCEGGAQQRLQVSFQWAFYYFQRPVFAEVDEVSFFHDIGLTRVIQNACQKKLSRMKK